MIEAPNVNSLMDSGLSAWLAQQQAVRDQAKATSRSRTISSVIAAVVLAFLVLVFVQNGTWAFIIGAGVAGAGQAWAYAARKPVIDAIKHEMNTRIAATLGLTFSNTAIPGPELDLALSHDVLPRHDTKDFEDSWTGAIADMPFSLYESHLQAWRGTGKNRHLETVFRGVVMTVGFARQFHGVTLVERAGQHSTFFGMRDTITVNGLKLDRISMVHPRFADAFTVWSSDNVEARYLVHPAYVERLIELEQGFHGKKLRTLFHGGKLIIVVESDNLFESGSLDADQDHVRMEETIGQFMTLAKLARELNERPRG